MTCDLCQESVDGKECRGSSYRLSPHYCSVRLSVFPALGNRIRSHTDPVNPSITTYQLLGQLTYDSLSLPLLLCKVGVIMAIFILLPLREDSPSSCTTKQGAGHSFEIGALHPVIKLVFLCALEGTVALSAFLPTP